MVAEDGELIMLSYILDTASVRHDCKPRCCVLAWSLVWDD